MINVVSANKTPPHNVSINATLLSHFLKIAKLVVSNTPYMTTPNKKASNTGLFVANMK
tara:strand:+ start:3021 stop:3194 length:174 start_codon:yes stop_codon:yes gene_type:complete